MRPEQKKTLIWGSLGIAAHVFLLFLILQWLDGYPGPIVEPGERIELALKMLVLPAGFLLVVIHAVALARLFTGAIDPQTDDASQSINRWRFVDQRVLANSVEQTVVFMPLFLAFSMLVQADETPWLIALPVIFTAARIVYWIGYRMTTIGRAPGMAAGFVINIGILVFVVLTAI